MLVHYRFSCLHMVVVDVQCFRGCDGRFGVINVEDVCQSERAFCKAVEQ